MAKRKVPRPAPLVPAADYDGLLGELVTLLETARRTAARAVNGVMTVTYWQIGRRIVEVEQKGGGRADDGDVLVKRLAVDLTARFGRGFSWRNLYLMRAFYLVYGDILQTPSAKSEGPVSVDSQISPTLSAKLATGMKQQTPTVESAKAKKAQTAYPELSLEKSQTASRKLPTASAKLQTFDDTGFATSSCLTPRIPLPWSHHVRLLSVKNEDARRFDEQEAIRGGWTERQLDRQTGSQFYERTLLSRNKAAMLRKGMMPEPGDNLTPEEEIRDPLVLEFLDLKDEYSEHDLEEALIHKLEDFLLELGSDFAFIGRKKRLRVGDEWYRIDLLFFHRRLRCLVVIDLKIGKFTHVDSGQMHLYLNYARENWTHPDENPPVGLILCAEKDEAVAHYALEGLPNKVMASEYRLALPDEKALAEEVRSTQRALELRGRIGHASPRTEATIPKPT